MSFFKVDEHKNWKLASLGEVFQIERGGSPRPIEDYITADANGLNWIKIGDTKGVTKYIRQTAEKIKPSGLHKTRMVYEGDFILSNSMSFGRPFIMQTSGCIHDGWLVIRKNHSIIDPEYLYYVLSSPFAYEQFSLLAKGSTVKNLNIEAVKKVYIPIPPLHEQHRIVEKIEELFSDLDKGIESLKTAQQLLRVYRQAVLKWAFEGRLTNPDLKEGELPEGWSSELVKNISDINPKLPKREYLDSLNVTFLPMKNVAEIINKIDVSESRKFGDVKKGFTPMAENDVIFAKITPCMENGKIAVVKGLKNGVAFGSTEFHVFRCHSRMLNTYLFYYLVQERTRNEAERNMTGAVGQKRVPKKFLEELVVPFPNDLIEQSRVVSEIESRLTVCDKIEEGIISSIHQSNSLRQSILKMAFEGKLVPQDPSDPPVVLERNGDNVESKPVKGKPIKIRSKKSVTKRDKVKA